MPRKGPHRYGAYERAHRKDTQARVEARRLMEKKYGDLPSTTHVDHKKEIIRGGDNNESNLRLRPQRENVADKSWRHGR